MAAGFGSEYRFQSTRPSRGETLRKRHHRDRLRGISIHSPLAGRDDLRQPVPPRINNFNPLAPRGARPSSDSPSSFLSIFQSTRPSRGETRTDLRSLRRGDYFNPLAPRGARQQTVTKYFLQKLFTLHNSYPCKFGNRDYKQENEVCLGKKQAYIWCEPTRNWV